MLNKQAKVLNEHQIRAVLKYLESCKRNKLRNQIIFLLSLHGLRSKEIASLQVSMITDANNQVGQQISLENKASKGRSGRIVPINNTLQQLLKEYLENRSFNQDSYLITNERRERFKPNAITVFFKRLYARLGFVGCSSHSGRRTFITNCARKVSQAGGSIRDVMSLAGHKNLATTQRYIDQDAEAQKKLVALVSSNW